MVNCTLSNCKLNISFAKKRRVEEEHTRDRRGKFPFSEYCLESPFPFEYARQAGVRIFLPSAEFVRFVFGAAHLPQILYAVVGFDTIDVVDLLGETTVYEKEHQPMFP